MDLQALDNTFGIVHMDKGLMLQSFRASSVLSKVARDKDLSWEQLTEGKQGSSDAWVPVTETNTR